MVKESQRANYERQNDLLRELRGVVSILARVQARTSERNAEDLGIALQLIDVVAKDIDVRLMGMKAVSE